MEAIYNDMKDLITSEGNKAFAQLGLPQVQAADFVFGVIDPARHSRPVIMALMPTTLDITSETLAGGWTESSAVSLSFAVKGFPYNTLMHYMCAYAESLRILFMDCPDIKIGETRYYPDCGNTPMTMTGAEIDLTIDTRRH